MKVGERLERLFRREPPAFRAPRQAFYRGLPASGRALPASAAELYAAFERFDEAGAQHAFDRVLAQEHFASQILGRRLLALAQGRSGGIGPQAAKSVGADRIVFSGAMPDRLLPFHAEPILAG